MRDHREGLDWPTRCARIETLRSSGPHLLAEGLATFTTVELAPVVLRHVLTEIGRPNAEVFPKQYRLDAGSYGDFISAPLCG